MLLSTILVYILELIAWRTPSSPVKLLHFSLTSVQIYLEWLLIFILLTTPFTFFSSKIDTYLFAIQHCCNLFETPIIRNRSCILFLFFPLIFFVVSRPVNGWGSIGFGFYYQTESFDQYSINYIGFGSYPDQKDPIRWQVWVWLLFWNSKFACLSFSSQNSQSF